MAKRLLIYPLAAIALLGCSSPTIQFRIVDAATGTPLGGVHVIRTCQTSTGLLGIGGTLKSEHLESTAADGLTSPTPLQPGDIFTIRHPGHDDLTLQSQRSGLAIVRRVFDPGDNPVNALLKTPRYKTVRLLPQRRGEPLSVPLAAGANENEFKDRLTEHLARSLGLDRMSDEEFESWLTTTPQLQLLVDDPHQRTIDKLRDLHRRLHPATSPS